MAEADSTEPRFPIPAGLKSCAEVSDLIARPLRTLVEAVQAGQVGERELDVDLIRDSHAAFFRDFRPDIAGRWREGPVAVVLITRSNTGILTG